MKKSISKVLSKRVLAVVILAVVLLYAGAFFAVNILVSSNTKKHAETLVAIYSDLSTYEAKEKDKPVDENHADNIELYGDYVCKWYKVDAATMYVPDFDNHKVRYITFSASDSFEKNLSVEIPRPGDEYEYDFSDDEIAVWKGEKTFAHISLEESGMRELVTIMCNEDDFGNRFFVAVTTNYTSIFNDTLKAFGILAVLIALVVLIVYFSTRRDIDTYVKQSTELDMAARIQAGFLPKNTINANDYYIQCMMRPAANIGGDLYDYIELDNNRTLMIIADVSGKGMPASIMMAVTLILIREYAKLDLSPAEILDKANKTLCEKNPAMLFVTAFLGIYDRRNKTFTYANAGHNLPYIIGDNLKTVDNNAGPVLGLFEDEKYRDNSVQLQTGDTIFMYTDGVTEVINNKKEFYGEERLANVLNRFTTESSANIVDEVFREIRDFSGDAEQFDDITMLTLTVKDTVVLSLDYDIKEFEKIKTLVMDLPVDRTQKMNICLAAEEIFANKCEYAFPDGVPAGEKITFALSQADMIILRFEDGGEKYDPLENMPDVDDYDPDTQMGGLGMFLTSKIVDDIRYDYADNKNIISLIKYYEEDK